MRKIMTAATLAATLAVLVGCSAPMPMQVGAQAGVSSSLGFQTEVARTLRRAGVTTVDDRTGNVTDPAATDLWNTITKRRTVQALNTNGASYCAVFATYPSPTWYSKTPAVQQTPVYVTSAATLTAAGTQYAYTGFDGRTISMAAMPAGGTYVFTYPDDTTTTFTIPANATTYTLPYAGSYVPPRSVGTVGTIGATLATAPVLALDPTLAVAPASTGTVMTRFVAADPTLVAAPVDTSLTFTRMPADPTLVAAPVCVVGQPCI